MKRFSLILVLLLTAGCGIHWRPSTKDGDTQPVETASVASAAVKSFTLKAQALADAERQVAAEIRKGGMKEYADIEDFGSKLRKQTITDAAIAGYYAELRAEQEKRLGKDKDGYIDVVRDKSGNPDWEATAKIYDETAEGFDRIVKGAK